VLQIKPGITCISFFLFSLYNAWSFEYFLFLFTNLIIYIEIWQSGFIGDGAMEFLHSNELNLDDSFSPGHSAYYEEKI
jgi:hypothetical protein